MASPWAEVGDAGLRTDIEVLHQHGLIRGPITTWPIPWGQISANLRSKDESQLPVYVRRSLRRVQRKLKVGTDSHRLKSSFKVRASVEPSIVRGFETVARDEVDARAAAEYMTRHFAGRVSFGYQGQFEIKHGKGVWDDSYAAVRVGNWLFYGGLLDAWWGPGWESSLLMSNNARPYPKFGFMRYNPTATDLPIINWLGPWQINGSVGVLEESGRFIDNPLVFAMRGTINPLPGLEISAARVLQFCGDAGGTVLTEDLACGFGDFFQAMGGFNQPGAGAGTLGNSLGGFSARYTNSFLGQPFAIYGQVIGEDDRRTAGISLPFELAGLFGLSLWGGIGDGGLWRITTEYSDSAARFHDSNARFNLFYDHFQYRSGYRYRRRSLGHSLDADSRLFSVVGTLTDLRDWTYRLAYRHAEINRDGASGSAPHSVSRNSESLHMVEAGLSVPWKKGVFDFRLRLRDNEPNTPGGDSFDFGAEIGWSARF
jgi:hypothetical protein